MTGAGAEAHYRRYCAVLHLQTSAFLSTAAYQNFPLAHRPESREEAMRLDSLLEELWRDHPRYYKIVARSDFGTKISEAVEIIRSDFQDS